MRFWSAQDCKPSFGDANRMPEFDAKAEFPSGKLRAVKQSFEDGSAISSLKAGSQQLR